MPEESVPAPPADARVSTGTPGLDAMLEGGLVPRRPYLIVGPSGTGKTTLAIQFLCEGIRRGERALLVTIEEPPNEARMNHRGLDPELSHVYVFDAIPDIMRYERVPFKDIASVRSSVAFKDVPLAMRRSPELSAVEVTMTGLEQMLRTEVTRRNYTRLVIDSLTALQYFCMKGFDAVAGAQTFLRFLSDLRITTLLTVESPLEDVETPERALARGEIRLFRWELEGQTVRAIGVEKFRGSPHDVRLHPYRIGPKGIDINLEVTISRDTREIIETRWPAAALPVPVLLEESTSPIDPLADVVRDLVLVGADVGPVKVELEAALGAAEAGDVETSRGHLSRATALATGLTDAFRDTMNRSSPASPEVGEAYQRIVQRGEAVRAGLPPTRLPPPKVLELQLEQVLSLISSTTGPPTPELAESVAPTAVAPIATIAAEVPGVEPPPSARSEAPPSPAPPAPPQSVEASEAAAVSFPPVPAPPSPETATPSSEASEAGRFIAPPPEAPPPPLPPLASTPPPPSASPLFGPPPLPTASTSRTVAAAPTPAPAPPSLEGPHPGSTAPRRTHGARLEEHPPLPSLRLAPPQVLPSRPSPTSRPAESPTRAPPSASVRPSPPPLHAPGRSTPPVSTTAVPATPAPKRRRKAPTTSRRKPPVAAAPSPLAEVGPVTPAATETTSSPEHPSPVTSDAGTTEVPLTTGTAPTTKPKKRTARKRKAPTVVAVTAGTLPPESSGGPDDRAHPEARHGPSQEGG